ncbi:MAG: ribonuclease HII [Thermoanaerobaculia bacterium]
MAELHRISLLCRLEERLMDCGFPYVAGVDEAGRGCLAGPVVAAAVITDPNRWIPGVDDSKKIPAKRRKSLARMIKSSAFAYAVAEVSAVTIDRINILEATRLAMNRALDSLPLTPDCAMVDAVVLRRRKYPCYAIVRGDALSYSVSCASILAKEARDRMMIGLDQKYPCYGFASHKGYGAVRHLRALAEYGPCPIHRLTFKSVLPRTSEVHH